MKTSRTQVVLGPPIPVIRTGDFSEMRLTHEQWANAWQIVGPSVERNMNGMRPIPLWMMFCAAYLEGLQHGAALAAEKPTKKPTERDWVRP